MKSPAAADAHVGSQATESNWLTAVRAAQEKKAHEVVVLDLREITSLTDQFVICHGNNARQNQAISDEIYLRMKEQHGDLPLSREGYENAEWILQDYGDFIVHIFTEECRKFYGLERLWGDAPNVTERFVEHARSKP